MQSMELPHTSGLIGRGAPAALLRYDDTHGQSRQQETDSMFGNRFSIAAEHQLQVTERSGR